ncbi:TIGR02452 family protein [Adlercreutzia sp. ZJ473]|uniref:TIGR02452 family protein n=1 Tax=Adlercreutzia sp. ZJ473 TaxID=2722822 RepID=UPI001557EBD1|nr:TIGR02452 family protein [Adlercreutzia sp. ZJ473]
MADRDERREQAAKHNALMKGAFASETAACAAAATIYEEGAGRTLELGEAPFDATETRVTTAFAPEALYRQGAGKTAVVDPAAFTRPGGAYEDGAFGPEQILCAASNLYQVLCEVKGLYHDKNRDYRRGGLFTDRAAYLPDVAFSRDGSIRKADVIVIPEPLRARALENHRSERECDRALADRVETIMRIAAANGCETLIVGAFGCGRLGYPAEQVTSLFSAWIEAHPGAVARVVFAVPRAAFDAFDAAFGKSAREEAAAAAAQAARASAEDEDADEFDWRSVELPEGVTIR